MAINADSGEKYVLVSVDDKTLSNTVMQEIQEKVLSLWETNNENIVVEFTGLAATEPVGMAFLKDLSAQALEKGCSFILAGSNAVLANFAEENQISFAPTREEAVDLVLIEEIEREIQRN